MPDLKHFPKIREARELLMAHAEELIELKKRIIFESIAAGDYETADKATNWLLEHMPMFEGITVIDPSIDKPKQIEKGTTLPTINIGFALGGITKEKALPAVTTEVIDLDE